LILYDIPAPKKTVDLGKNVISPKEKTITFRSGLVREHGQTCNGNNNVQKFDEGDVTELFDDCIFYRD